MIDKPALREALRARRRAADAQAQPARDAALTAAILAAPQWSAAAVLSAFVGVGGEPSTAALLDAAWAQGKQLWLPRVHAGALQFVRTTAREQLIAGCFGLLEPAIHDTPPCTLGELAPALVLVPGLGFGRDGARIGFGRGYYDRALAPLRTRADVFRLGVCHAGFLDPPEGPIPMDEHDVPMHAIATEFGIVACMSATG